MSNELLACRTRRALFTVALAFVALTALAACTLRANGTASTSEADPANEPASTSGADEPTAPSTPPKPHPLGAGVGAWTWVDVPESTCANGEPTGIAANLGTGKDLVIFLVGGGGCWDALTCFGVGTAMNIKDGYTKADFETDLEGFLKPIEHGSLFDRSEPNNPFKDSSFVFIPYCTGDIHAGDTVREFLVPPRKVHFAGRRNIDAFLKRIVPAFQDTSRVTLVGASAGGFGAALNYWRFQDAFGATRVDLIDDSGPALEQWQIPLLPVWKQAWDMDGACPPGCGECKKNIATLPAYYSATYPSSRLALLSYADDNVISVFFLTTQELFAAELESTAAKRIDPLPNMRYFIAPGSGHVVLGDLTTTSGGVTVGSWLGQMVSDSPVWANISPP